MRAFEELLITSVTKEFRLIPETLPPLLNINIQRNLMINNEKSLHDIRFPFVSQEYVYSDALFNIFCTDLFSIPKAFSFSEYFGNISNFKNRRYLIRSIVIHHGRQVTGGHYTLFIRNFHENSWHSYNDGDVEILKCKFKRFTTILED